MAKAVTVKIKLVSSADTGFYYVTRKNTRAMTEKMKKKKYDPIVRKHVEFTEQKIK
jgi:large subunit ribosomal protein L33